MCIYQREKWRRKMPAVTIRLVNLAKSDQLLGLKTIIIDRLPTVREKTAKHTVLHDMMVTGRVFSQLQPLLRSQNWINPSKLKLKYGTQDQRWKLLWPSCDVFFSFLFAPNNFYFFHFKHCVSIVTIFFLLLKCWTCWLCRNKRERNDKSFLLVAINTWEKPIFVLIALCVFLLISGIFYSQKRIRNPKASRIKANNCQL